jgi:hypothetical protein
MPNSFTGRNVAVQIKGDVEMEAPIHNADAMVVESENGSVNIKAVKNEYHMERETFSISADFFGSQAISQGRGIGGNLLNEIPLLGALKGLLQSQGDQAMVCAGLNTCFAAIGTIRELQAAGGLHEYLLGRLCKVGVTMSVTDEEMQVLQEVGMKVIKPGAKLTVKAKDPIKIAGLSGDLDSFFAKGRSVELNPLKTHTSYSMDTSSFSIGGNLMTGSVSAGVGMAESATTSTTYQTGGFSAKNLTIVADDDVKVGVMISTLSSFIQCKRLEIYSSKNSSFSESSSFGVSMGLTAADVSSVGASFSAGNSNIESGATAGITGAQMHVWASEGVKLKSAVLKLTDGAKPVQDANGLLWYLFDLTDVIDVTEDPVVAVKKWARGNRKAVSMYSMNGTTLICTQPCIGDCLNVLINDRIYLMNSKPGVLEASYVNSSSINTVEKISYVALDVPDIMALASFSGALSVDFKNLDRRSTTRSQVSGFSDTSSIKFTGDAVVDREIDRVLTDTRSKVDISLKAIPLVVILGEKEKKKTVEEDEGDENRPPFKKKSKEQVSALDLMGLEFNVFEAEESKADSDHKEEPKEAKRKDEAVTRNKETLGEEPVQINDDGRRFLRKSFFVERYINNQSLSYSTTEHDDEGQESSAEKEMSLYKKSIYSMIWLAEGSEDTLRFLDSAKSNYSTFRLILKATPAKIFVDLVGKKISKELLRNATKETIVRILGEAIFLTVADDDIPLTRQRVLQKRVHNASEIIYDWYALAMTNRGLGEDLADFGQEVSAWTRRNWRAMKKSGVAKWFKDQFSKEELDRRARVIVETMLERVDMDLKEFNKDPKAFMEKYQSVFYDRTIGYTPMAEPIYKGVRRIYQNHGEKIGDTMDLLD